MMSLVPLGGNGTTKRIGRLGYSAVSAASALAGNSAAQRPAIPTTAPANDSNPMISSAKYYYLKTNTYTQFADTVRAAAQSRNAEIFSAITTDSGRVRTVSVSTYTVFNGLPAACAS